MNSATVRLALLCAVATPLTGCATQWYKAGATPESFEADRQACQLEMAKVAAQDPLFIPMVAKACMQARGYTQVNP